VRTAASVYFARLLRSPDPADSKDTTRRDMLRLLSAGALGTLVTPAQPRRPNLIMILSDDMGWADAGFNGRKERTTPNLDRLAQEGGILDRW
jgi:Sulfatase